MNKICTTIEQSKKLIELGVDVKTADMYYFDDHYNISSLHPIFSYENYLLYKGSKHDYIPAWSLVALLRVIPNYKLSSEHNHHTCTAETSFGKETVAWFDSPVDACYEMVLKLNELKLL